MAQEKISVIVPAYNCENTIRRCLDAIFASTHQKLEVFVVDDGSTDRTAEFALEYTKKFEDVTVIRTENHGPASARNKALDQITGQYFLFADADDSIEPDAIEKLLAVAKRTKSHIVCGGYHRLEGDKKETILPPVPTGFISLQGNKQEVKRFHQMKTESCFGYVWNKLHETAFFKEQGLRLPECGVINLEDNIFYANVWTKHPRFFVTDIVVTNYVVGEQSLTRRYDGQYYEKSLRSMQACYRILCHKDGGKEAMTLVAPLVLRLYCFTLVRNARYEKASLRRWKTITQGFLQQKEFRAIVQAKSCIPALQTIQNSWHRIGFCVCARLLQKRWEVLFLLALRIGYPLVATYIKKTLKWRWM